MSGGRAQEVLSNSLHGAITQSHDSFADAYHDALGLTDAACGCWDEFSIQILPLTHSIMQESRYVSPFQASLNALELQWDVCRDLSSNIGQFDCLAPVLASILRSCQSSQRPHGEHAVQKQVRFVDQIDVLIGDDEVLEMGCLNVSQGVICNWKLKPWSKRRIKKNVPIDNRWIDPQEALSNLAVLSRDSITSSFDNMILPSPC